MAKTKKFPNLIHVTRDDASDGTDFLAVREDGALDTSIDETLPCAVYKLVGVGEMQVERRFVEKPARRGRTS